MFPRETPIVLLIVLSAACTPAYRAPAASIEARIIPSTIVPVSGVDLGISDDETYKRPNSWAKNQQPLLPTERLLLGEGTGAASRPGVSIAWRNALQVEEVEVRIRNLGDQPGEGRVWVDVLSESGELLLHLEPPDDQKVIRVPAFERGGREGKILRMKASRELNNLIDRYDRERRRYDVRATVETVEVDANLFDNSKTKSWNIPFSVQPGFTNVYNYIFRNTTTKPATVRWLFEHTPYPAGWKITGVPSLQEPFVLRPAEELRGSLMLIAPLNIQDGSFLEARISLVDEATGAVFMQHEWFQVYDTEPPIVSNYRLVTTADHRLAIQVLVADPGSGVLEATGVTTEYSTDDGRTWSTRAHNYKAGNFIRPTLFEAVLGPFTPGTEVQLRFTAKDTAGNVSAVIPVDAAGLAVPPSVEKLLETAYIFPRTQPNPLFEVVAGDVDVLSAIEHVGADPADDATKRVVDPILAMLADLPPAERRVISFPLERVSAPASNLLQMSTIRVKVR